MFIGHIRPQKFRPAECCVLPNSHTRFHTQMTHTLIVYIPNCIKYSSSMKYYNYVFLFYYLIHYYILNSKCHSVESNKHQTSLPYVFLSQLPSTQIKSLCAKVYFIIHGLILFLQTAQLLENMHLIRNLSFGFPL